MLAIQTALGARSTYKIFQLYFLYYRAFSSPKAIDTVDHAILLSKLRFMGFENQVITCYMHDYLSDQQQRVLFGGDLSDWGTVSIGVPQGSI